MAKHLLAVFSNPTEGQEDEYNDWYTNHHLAEILEIPGFNATTRFRLTGYQAPGFLPSQHRYMTLYEFEGDPEEVIGRLLKRVESGDIALPASIDASTIGPWCFEAITDRVTAEAPVTAE